MTGPREQLPLDLPHQPSLGAADFLVAPCNAEAVDWLNRWPAWPAPALALVGPPGCGKTHLARVFAARVGAALVAASRLSTADPPALLANHPAVVVEDGDQGVDERALLHLYNSAGEARCRLLLTGRAPPARWPLTLPDLRSRLATATVAAIGAPDDALMAALLVKLFADRQLRVGQAALAFLASRMERTFAAAEALVATVDAGALRAGRDITIPFLRDLLKE